MSSTSDASNLQIWSPSELRSVPFSQLIEELIEIQFKELVKSH